MDSVVRYRLSDQQLSHVRAHSLPGRYAVASTEARQVSYRPHVSPTARGMLIHSDGLTQYRHRPHRVRVADCGGRYSLQHLSALAHETARLPGHALLRRAVDLADS